MKSRNVRTLVLALSIVCYLLLGAVVFDALESDGESSRKRALEQKLHELKEKYGFTEDDYGDMEKVALQWEPHRAGRQWKFAGSFYFAITVVTTIGLFLLLGAFGSLNWRILMRKPLLIRPYLLKFQNPKNSQHGERLTHDPEKEGVGGSQLTRTQSRRSGVRGRSQSPAGLPGDAHVGSPSFGSISDDVTPPSV